MVTLFRANPSRLGIVWLTSSPRVLHRTQSISFRTPESPPLPSRPFAFRRLIYIWILFNVGIPLIRLAHDRDRRVSTIGPRGEINYSQEAVVQRQQSPFRDLLSPDPLNFNFPSLSLGLRATRYTYVHPRVSIGLKRFQVRSKRIARTVSFVSFDDRSSSHPVRLVRRERKNHPT